MNRCVLIPLIGCLAACQPGEDSPSPATEKATEASVPVVYAVNYPLAWMAERIGGNAVDVAFPVPPGVDPAHWQPSPEMVLEYQAADLVLLNGGGYAGWTRFASLSPVRSVSTLRGLEDRLLPAGEVTHTHGPGGDHEHGDVASHTWLDPTLAGEQARAVAEALTKIAPLSTTDFDTRLEGLLAELAKWDHAMSQFFSALPPTQIFFSHPIYQYLDARYGLGGHAVAWEPDTEPDEEQWRSLEAAVDVRRTPLMLWEAAPLESVSARLQAIGIGSVVFETGANPELEDGYEQLLKRNWLALQNSLSRSAAPGNSGPGLPGEG